MGGKGKGTLSKMQECLVGWRTRRFSQHPMYSLCIAMPVWTYRYYGGLKAVEIVTVFGNANSPRLRK